MSRFEYHDERKLREELEKRRDNMEYNHILPQTYIRGTHAQGAQDSWARRDILNKASIPVTSLAVLDTLAS